MKPPIAAIVLSALAFVTLLLVSSPGQSPAPLIIQAATPAPGGVAPASLGTAPGGSKSMMQLLQEMQATNAGTIKKQQAALETLDRLQKAAEEIKIFSKRG